MEARPRVFAVAYRMLGSASDADDIVQEAYLRWQQSSTGRVVNSAAFLQKTAVRLCLDHLKSARHRREVYPGEWLPEPIILEDPIAPQDVSYAVLCTLERLSPLERAAYLLHDIFDLDYNDLSHTLDRPTATCRQLVTRARRHIGTDASRNKVNAEKGETLMQAFFVAAKTGDTQALTQLLTEDAVLVSDGGGKASAALNPIIGREKVRRLCLGLAAKTGHQVPKLWKFCTLNRCPAVLSYEADGILQATLVELDGDQIRKIYVLRNPEKTAHLKGLM
ncbi:RNA polymerase sigma factor SigJ [Epibacterium ulvae]|nr:RNA polymerase sigma factor SigJ [Epibacterium ulvae]